MSTEAGNGQQAPTLDEALAIVRTNKGRMLQCLDTFKLMDGLKHASTMLSELRTCALGPKQYYELYISVFDALRYLSTYLTDAHKAGRHHLADLYELVQYAGNIVPRLYLMITVGSVYMGVEDAPIKEIMKDMMEMSRGVQHPIRGLFLRHYLSGQTRDHMPLGTSEGPEGNLQESINFTITNFIEMNKLWVRLQHQGHSRERHMRATEREELKTLVGTNLVRLSEMDGVTLDIYQTQIVPAVLEQIVQCRDILAQEYLMEVVTQVFPDDWHLRTLQQYLSAIAKLNPNVNVKQIVVQLINRLAAYASREAENESPEERERKEEEAATKLAETIRSMKIKEVSTSEMSVRTQSDKERNSADEGLIVAKNDSGQGGPDTKSDDSNIPNGSETGEIFRGIPTEVKLFEVFWEQIVKLVKARPDIKIQDVTALVLSLCNLALNCYPAHLEYIEKIMDFTHTKVKDYQDSTDLHSNETRMNLERLLLAPVSTYKNPLTILVIPCYIPFLRSQAYAIRRSVATEIVDILLSTNHKIETTAEAEGVFDLVRVLIGEGDQLGNIELQGPRRGREADLDDIIEEQGRLARLIHLLRSSDLDTQYKLLQIARRALADGGDRIRYTYPPIVMKALTLARQWKAREHIDDEWSQKAGSLYKFVHSTISLLNDRAGLADMAYRNFVFAGQIADQGGFEEVAYELFAQAFTVYEESISESKAQFQSVALVANALQQTRSFSKDNYDTLVTKCALYGAKLLKKPDQTRAVLLASHLWWATDILPRGEEENKTLYHDDKRVLECLQKALKIADACMDTATSIQLFVEILNRYIYYFERQNEAIAPKFVNGLVDLIRQNLENMEITSIPRGGSMVHSTSALAEPEGNVHEFIKRHFERTLKHMEMRKEEEQASGRWADIVI